MITYNNSKDTEIRSNVDPLSLEETETLIEHLNSILPQYGAIISDNLQRMLDHHANLQHLYDNAGGWEGLAKIQKDNEELKGKIAELILAIDPIDTLAGYHKMTEILYGTIKAKPLNISHNDKWISVNERLPDDWDNYLVSLGKTTGELTYHPEHKWCWIEEDGYVTDFNSSVTHWQPLPEPPTE